MIDEIIDFDLIQEDEEKKNAKTNNKDQPNDNIKAGYESFLFFI